MRIFISYARLDKPYCIQISNLLTAHDVWFDQRFYAGDKWWDEILRRLEWCEGFIYLLSPASVASTYCRQEFELAIQLQRNIFPVLIHDQTTVPEAVQEYQYVDLTNGLTPETTALLLNSIHNAERSHNSHRALPMDAMPRAQTELPVFNSASVISVAAAAMEKGQFDQAVFLFKQAKAKGFTSRFINIDRLLQEAERQLDVQAKEAQRDSDYRQIAALIRVKATRDMGCEAIGEFLKEYPSYDPEQVRSLCGGAISSGNGSAPAIPANSTPSKGQLGPGLAPMRTPIAQQTAAPVIPLIAPQTAAPNVSGFTLPLLDWVAIPAGYVTFEDVESDGARAQHTLYVPAFHISRYPVTNRQFQAFIDDPGGYNDPRWWDFSPEATLWRSERPNPPAGRFEGDDRPRDTVAWFDALAFTNWLTGKIQEDLCLPTSEQWFRAARGDTHRLYPWGDAFDVERCNVKECDLKMTTPVTRYPKGISLFEVWDMAGNTWEWTNSTKSGMADDLSGYSPRAVHGGAYHSEADRARIPFRYYLNPRIAHNSIGFRVVKHGK
ncbi:MAG: SUMF1/EgtB/PvdO family nonheme iron enzyme [Anaerolineae bacterium]|nr:SUMF1/EgtB/PvdO family nonheme iron enzyme [Anaerolineae bacterium]NUQ06430.1 SUMF1/EgtB/PvdO family nonheme iron enzyme [Anaerolineae bacterium]